MEKIEKVNHPQHYQFRSPAIEVADMTGELPHWRACVIEYVWRAGIKSDNTIEDLEKAKWWIDWKIDELDKEEEDESRLTVAGYL